MPVMPTSDVGMDSQLLLTFLPSHLLLTCSYNTV